MLYGKVIDGKFKYAPDTYITSDERIVIPNFNKSKELMYEFGYKPITEIYPKDDLDLKLLETYEEKGDEIIVTYIIDDTEKYLNSVREEKICKSKENLTNYLAKNPLKSSVKGGVEKLYTVTQEKQNLLSNVIVSYLNSALPYKIENKPIPDDIKIYWNCSGYICEEWTYEEITQLKQEMDEYIRPLVSMQQHLEVVLYGLPTQREIKELDVEFDEENIDFWMKYITD